MPETGRWTPEILRVDDDGTLILVAAPFDMVRLSSALLGRTVLIDGLVHRIEAIIADGRPRDSLIRKGERISLRVRRQSA